MAFNGNGVFARLYSWAQDRLAGIPIDDARMDDEMDGFADGLTNCLTRDGQSAPTANIPFNGKKITGLGDATADQDAVNRRAGDARWGRRYEVRAQVSGGSANALTLDTGQSLAALADGMTFTFIAGATSTAGDPTLNVDGIGAKVIKGVGAATLPIGAIYADTAYKVVYRASTDSFRLMTGAVPATIPQGLAINGALSAAGNVTVTGSYFKSDGTEVSYEGHTHAGYYTAGDSPTFGTVLAGQLETANGPLIIQRGGAGIAYVGYFNRGSDSGQILRFERIGTTVGNISVSPGATAYNTSSDRRIKTNITAGPDYGALIDALEVVEFEIIGDEDHTVHVGLIAQDLRPLMPTAVTLGSPEGVDPDDEDFVPHSVDLSKLVPILIREVQALRARVYELEALIVP